MRTKTIIAALLALAAAVACNKELPVDPETVIRDGNLSVSFSAEVPTRASDLKATEEENRLNSVDVFVFRASSSGTTAALEAHRRANKAELAAKTVRLEVIPGNKHVYAVANVPESLTSPVTDEASLKALFATFPMNSNGSFVMVGSPAGESNLTVGTAGNEVSVTLRRLVARVKLEKIEAAFPAAVEASTTLKVLRVYLTYVPKRVPLVNGDVDDVFGTPSDKSLDGRTYKDFYEYPVPEAGEDRLGRAENGFYNPGVLQNGKVKVESSVAAITERSANVALYGAGAPADHSWTPDGDLFLYAYPNPSVPVYEPRVHDFTTKLVIEAEVNGTVCWYPIRLPYTQPNCAYTINGIKITRPGSDDPNFPVYVSQCEVSMTVSDWTTGEFLGSYNHPDGDNGFIM